jgi:hypothetical protein
MSAALNPDMYREEYLKKLYKLLSENNEGDDTIKYFSDYVAGKIPAAALRSFVKQARLERKLKKGDTEGKKYWWSVGRPGYGASAEVVASNKEEAIAKGKQEYPDWASAQDMTAKPLRPYQEPTPQSAQQSSGPMLGNRPSNPDGNYVIVNIADETKPVYRYMAASAEDTLSVLRQWIAANPGQILYHYKYDPDQRLGQPDAPASQPAEPIPGSTLDIQRQRAAQYQSVPIPGVTDVELDIPLAQNFGNQFSGQWKVMIDGEEVWRFRGVGNNQADANRIGQTWILDQIRQGSLSPVEGADVEVLPVMI